MSIRRKQTSQVGAKRGKSHVTRSGVANWLRSRPEFIKSNQRAKKSSVEVRKANQVCGGSLQTHRDSIDL